MQNQNLNFLKSLLYSDFLLMTNQKKRYNNSKTKFQVLSVKKNKLNVLEPLEILKSLKQFIRVLQFIKGKKELGMIQVNSKNQQVYDIFESFFISEQSPFISFLTSSINTNKVSNNHSKLIIIIDTFFESNNYAIKNLFDTHFNLVIKMLPLNKHGLDWYSYKLYNELDNAKKIVYIYILIMQIFSQKIK